MAQGPNAGQLLSRRKDAVKQSHIYYVSISMYNTYFFALSTNKTRRPGANDIPPNTQILVSKPTQHLASRDRVR